MLTLFAGAIFLSCHFLLISARGNVGCLFSSVVCNKNEEWCFDDYAFGRCQPHLDDDTPADLYRYNLKREALHMLEREMTKLFTLGYRWNHPYTQCVLQNMLLSIREQTEYDDEICILLSDQDLNAALRAFEGDEEQNIELSRIAHVKFTPSEDDPHADFADEVYVPLIEDVAEDLTGAPKEVIRVNELPEEDEEYERKLINKLLEKAKRSKHHSSSFDLKQNYYPQTGVFPISDFLPTPARYFSDKYAKEMINQDDLNAVRSFSRHYNTPDGFRNGLETKDEIEKLKNIADRELLYDTYRNDAPSKELEQLVNNDENNEHFGVYTEGGMIYPKEDNGEEPAMEDFIKSYSATFGFGFKRPERLDVKKPGPAFSTNNFAFKEENDAASNNGKAQTANLKRTKGGEPVEASYIYIQFNESIKSWEQGQKVITTIAKLLGLNPDSFSPPRVNFNEMLFKFDPEGSSINGTEVVKKIDEMKKQIEDLLNVTVISTGTETLSGAKFHTKMEKSAREKKKSGSPLNSPNNRKSTSSPADDASDGSDPVDPTYVYIDFKHSMKTWDEGAKIVRVIATLMDLDANTFIHPKISDSGITFRVDPARVAINATEVAKKIDAMRSQIKDKLNIIVTSTGIGDKVKQPIGNGDNSGPPSIERLVSPDDRQLLLLSSLLCGIIAAALIAGTAFFVIRRHRKHCEKLQNLEQPDTEASKDYEELCRARMAKKNGQEKPETSIGRITGFGEAPSSNRSSTSSWTEEPALTNMDISTGHMVLSYMEDHLKNKDRLEQEWIALCAYEAEPCATTVARKPENAKKNRYPDVLPYDHARVVLNELINASGSDYINASTINDHDPRNPAYIATQGPLPHTAADLWQMVWEQGSVVMVMLTRLTENNASLCHRYWPEDGSEVYHIYEVHLVSEHIWCDDYLVRSFYLKNLKTGETRTMTQFHFLSWPENGVPLSTKALLEFRRKVNKSYRGRSCPIVVHCSDGVGRSGTYILIDMVLNRMAKGAKEIDIAATLEHIRDQRQMMVKTKQQFEFVLMAVAEEVHAILKALPATHSPPPLVKEKD